MITIHKSNFIYLSAGLICGFILFFGLDAAFNKENSTVTESRNKQNYAFINPLLECDSSSFDTKNLVGLKRQLTAIIDLEIDKKDISFASVYVRDLDNGPWVGVSEDELFSPASLIKVPILIAYLKQSESDPALLDKVVTNTRVFNPNEQNFAPEKHLEVNQTYTINELLYRMIVYSDNLAYEALLDNIDSNLIYKIYNDLGVDISQANNNPNGNILSVKSYAAFYRILFNSSYLSKDNSEKALELLSHTMFDKGITSSLPEGTIVSHKFGERQYLDTGEKQLHDCGIVYSPEKSYLLCVMTRGNSFTKASKTIGTISKAVYDKFNTN